MAAAPGERPGATLRRVVQGNQFPSLPAKKLMRVLKREPLQYVITRQSGSHKTLESNRGYPRLLLAFHDRDTIPRGLVRKILVSDVGLSVDEALDLL